MAQLTQETMQRYITEVQSRARNLATMIETIERRIDVRRIEQLVIEQEVLTDEQVEVLAKAQIAYVGTVGDSLDDFEKLRELQVQLEATSVLLVAVEKLAA